MSIGNSFEGDEQVFSQPSAYLRGLLLSVGSVLENGWKADILLARDRFRGGMELELAGSEEGVLAIREPGAGELSLAEPP